MYVFCDLREKVYSLILEFIISVEMFDKRSFRQETI